MIAALRYEWVRVSTLRSTWWIAGCSAGVGILISFFVAATIRLTNGSAVYGSLDEDESREVLVAMMTQFSNFDPVFYVVSYAVAILGIFAWGHEYRHGMIRATLTAMPQRPSVWLAKYLMVAAWVTAVVVLACVASLVVTMFWFLGADLHYDVGALFGAIGRRIVYSVLLSWIAMSLTLLLRNQTFGLVMIYLWPFLIENMIKGIFAFPWLVEHYDATRFLPFNAGSRIIQSTPAGDGLFEQPMDALGGFLLFGALTAVLMVAALASFQRRDA